MESQRQTIHIPEQQGILTLYDKYAGMLLGYIFEIVRDRELAELYMVAVFKSVAEQYNDIYRAENNWCKLQQLARVKLADFFKTVKDCDENPATVVTNTKDKLMSQMSAEQQTVFCAIYYHGKTTADLAKQLNKPELIIRKSLKEAFAIIRSSREHSGVH